MDVVAPGELCHVSHADCRPPTEMRSIDVQQQLCRSRYTTWKILTSMRRMKYARARVHARIGFIAREIVEISLDESSSGCIFNRPLAELIASSIFQRIPEQNFMHFSRSLELM